MFERKVLLLVHAVNHAKHEIRLVDTFALLQVRVQNVHFSNVLSGSVCSSMLVTSSTGLVSSTHLFSSTDSASIDSGQVQIPFLLHSAMNFLGSCRQAYTHPT
jgi:hypothetical protein